jgi:hypothetical protein
MDHNQLLSSAVELGLTLLEKNGSFIPFCKAVNEADEPFIYTAASDISFSSEQAYESVLFNVKRDIANRGLKGVAFCFDSRVRLSDSTEKVPAVEVAVHYKRLPATIWYFLYKMEIGKAAVIEYYTKAASESLFA